MLLHFYHIFSLLIILSIELCEQFYWLVLTLDACPQVVDARPVGRFNGTAPEPNPSEFKCDPLAKTPLFLQNSYFL